MLFRSDLEIVKLRQRFGEQRAFNRVVVGDCDDPKIGVVLNVIHDFRNLGKTITVVGMDMQIGLAPDVTITHSKDVPLDRGPVRSRPGVCSLVESKARTNSAQVLLSSVPVYSIGRFELRLHTCSADGNSLALSLCWRLPMS